MSLPNQLPFNSYQANGASTVFTFEFYLISVDDLQVSIDGQRIDSGFSVIDVGKVTGGSVIFLTPPTAGRVVMLERVVPAYRSTDYQDNGDLLADTLNKDFDRLWMALQHISLYLDLTLQRPLLSGPFNAQHYRIINGADPIDEQDFATKHYIDQVALAQTLRVPEKNVSLLPLAKERANKLLAFDTGGQPIVILPDKGTAADVLLELEKETGAGKVGALTPDKDKTTTQQALDNLADRASEMEKSIGDITGGIGEWNSTVDYEMNEIVRIGLSLYIAKRKNSQSRPLSSKTSINDWCPLLLNDPITVTVPTLFDTLTQAVTYFDKTTATQPVTIVINGSIADKNIQVTNSALRQLIIRGGEIQLGTDNGIIAKGSGVNVEVNNVKYIGAGPTAGGDKWTNTAVANFAMDGAAMILKSVTTTKVYYGAQAARAFLSAEYSSFLSGGDAGVLAFDGGQIYLKRCESNQCYDAAHGLGYGYVAEAGGSIWLQNCSSTLNVIAGLFANIGGHIRDDDGRHSGNVRACKVCAGSNIEMMGSQMNNSNTTNAEVLGGALSAWNTQFNGSKEGNGMYVTGGGVVHLHNCSTNSNKAYGIISEGLSSVKLYSSHTASGNKAGPCLPATFQQLGENGGWISN
ncbi:hypothetical protein HGT73_05395 [Rosenbergiella australiborealis]|uniref:Uncharacterized protein n=1 Tax=Rosenbergiella australiborealis TaxID=1544696 RepID=A0ABS5T3U5_9GAMM|nr:phage tail fiber protein [Rosenbergiella australiborealis]MBT0726822.1 hypothetical protein [Rosenbergiella australiborealis]